MFPPPFRARFGVTTHVLYHISQIISTMFLFICNFIDIKRQQFHDHKKLLP